MSRLLLKPTKWMCAQRRLETAWVPAQSDQSSLCAHWVGKGPCFLHADSEDWSDWADAQADLSLRWAHMPFCWFWHEMAQKPFEENCRLLHSGQSQQTINWWYFSSFFFFLRIGFEIKCKFAWKLKSYFLGKIKQKIKMSSAEILLHMLCFK